MAERTIGFFRYFGSKKRIANRYPFPRRRTIIEPFAGAAGYSTLYHRNQVKLFDISEYVCGVWDFLINATPEDILSIPLFSDKVFKTPYLSDTKLPQEIQWFLGFWASPTGASTPQDKLCGYAENCATGKRGRLEGGWEEHTRERLSKQVLLIKHWTIEQKSYKEVEDEDATWFIDPPYQKQGDKYQGHSEIDFKHLAEWCQSRTGQVIVCERLGATWLPFFPFTNSYSSGKRANCEVIYYK